MTILLLSNNILGMETTRNELSPYGKTFFNSLSNYIDKKIYYFGSVQRVDYFPNDSDIDVNIFTDNESSTLFRIQNFLNIDKSKIKKCVIFSHKSKKLVKGYKINYNDEIHSFKAEILLFNDKYKDDVLFENTSKVNIPVYISVLLIILKFVYHKLHIIPTKLFIRLKHFIMETCGKSEIVLVGK